MTGKYIRKYPTKFVYNIMCMFGNCDVSIIEKHPLIHWQNIDIMKYGAN